MQKQLSVNNKFKLNGPVGFRLAKKLSNSTVGFRTTSGLIAR